MSGVRMGASEKLMLVLTTQYGFEAEVPFAGLSGRRKYRWDAAHPTAPVVFEYQGYGPGHHTRQKMARDARKISEGQLAGLTVIVCTSETVDDGSCLELIERALHDTSQGSEALADAWDAQSTLRGRGRPERS